MDQRWWEEIRNELLLIVGFGVIVSFMVMLYFIVPF